MLSMPPAPPPIAAEKKEKEGARHPIWDAALHLRVSFRCVEQGFGDQSAECTEEAAAWLARNETALALDAAIQNLVIILGGNSNSDDGNSGEHSSGSSSRSTRVDVKNGGGGDSEATLGGVNEEFDRESAPITKSVYVASELMSVRRHVAELLRSYHLRGEKYFSQAPGGGDPRRLGQKGPAKMRFEVDYFTVTGISHPLEKIPPPRASTVAKSSGASTEGGGRARGRTSKFWTGAAASSSHGLESGVARLEPGKNAGVEAAAVPVIGRHIAAASATFIAAPEAARGSALFPFVEWWALAHSRVVETHRSKRLVPGSQSTYSGTARLYGGWEQQPPGPTAL